jgi:hypothetical protein
MKTHSEVKVDVVIPVHEKDLATLPWCLNGIRANIPVARILVIGNVKLKSSVEILGVEFVDEDSVVPGITFNSFSGSRGGWYFQQLLKLGIADHIKSDYYLAVDADAVFLRKIRLFDDNHKPLYAIGSEFYRPYFDTFEQLLGFKAHREFSFIVHHMLFKTQRVIEMRELFAHDGEWPSAIINCMKRQLPFSEYETYGHYIKEKYPDEFSLRPLFWSDIWILPTPYLLRRLATHYDVCAFHAHYRENPLNAWKRLMIRVKIERRLIKFQLQALFK